KDSFISLILRPHFKHIHTIMRRYTFLFLITPLFFAVCQGDENGVREICDGNGSNANLVRNPATSDLALDTNNLACIVHAMAVHIYLPPTKSGYNNATFNNAITDIESIIVPSITI
ncbi:MAG: hypothetical protein RIR11_4838, partial [Bacteroidota bacterium]